MYFVYILRCSDRSLYTGITTDVQRRFAEHKRGKGGSYTRSRRVHRVVYTEEAATRSAAQKRESEIKSWARQKKLDFIRSQGLRVL